MKKWKIKILSIDEGSISVEVRVKFLLVICCLVLNILSGTAQDRGMFVGLRQVENCATAIDSMMLQRQNELYTGQRGSQESHLYNKWLQDPLVYTPMMEAAWQYCQKVVPGEKRLYVDAAELYRYVIRKSTTRKDSDFYFNKLMKLYDLRLENLEIINEHARRVEDLTSRGALALMKIREYRIYKNDSALAKDPEYNQSIYEQYLPVMNGIFETMKQGNAVGSDVKATDLQDFFIISFNHYANLVNGTSNNDESKLERNKAYDESKEREKVYRSAIANFNKEMTVVQQNLLKKDKSIKTQAEFNEKVAPLIKPLQDSVAVYTEKVKEEIEVQKGINEARENANLQSNQRTAALRSILISHYDGLYSLSDMQKKVLAQDIYNDSTLTEDQQQYEVDQIYKQYDGLVAYCQYLLSQANINLGESTIADLDMKYGDSIAANRNNGAWLEMVWNKCNNTTDFDPSDPFCETIYNAVLAYNTSMAAAQQAEREKKKASLQVQRVVSQNAPKGRAAWVKANSFLQKGDEKRAVEYLYLALYYYNKAVKEDPSHRSARNQLSAAIPGHDFMVGLKGKTITVDGVTFTAGN